MEDRIVQRAEKCLSLHSGSSSPIYNEYKILLDEYEKLLHKFNKVIAISDKYQIQLQEVTHDLKSTLMQLNQLKEVILPICIFCKKIRTDNNYWQQIESYFAQHLDLAFSHGICPECMKKKYGEFLKDVEPDQ